MFLHVGWFHLVGNMLFLAVYGRYVEERLGPWRYLGAYLLFGFVAGGVYCGFSKGPMVGASGAIAGLMGFVLVGAPWVQVRTYWIFLPFVQGFEIAAFWLVGLWILWQAFWAWAFGDFSSVAYSAHFGGFCAGCGLAALLRSPLLEGTPWYFDPAPPGGGEAAVRRLHHARSAARPAVAKVTLSSLPTDASPVAVIKLLMKHTSMPPELAKGRVDALSRGTPHDLSFADDEAARRFVREAALLRLEVSAGAKPQPSRAPVPFEETEEAQEPVEIAADPAGRPEPPEPARTPPEPPHPVTRLSTGEVLRLEDEEP